MENFTFCAVEGKIILKISFAIANAKISFYCEILWNDCTRYRYYHYLASIQQKIEQKKAN